ncbi:MAG TPA: hypothetical protein VNF04_08175 [Stellaceae bacterium]|nr:hypothetical protein [Stellaceae bacterium]
MLILQIAGGILLAWLALGICVAWSEREHDPDRIRAKVAKNRAALDRDPEIVRQRAIQAEREAEGERHEAEVKALRDKKMLRHWLGNF